MIFRERNKSQQDRYLDFNFCILKILRIIARVSAYTDADQNLSTCIHWVSLNIAFQAMFYQATLSLFKGHRCTQWEPRCSSVPLIQATGYLQLIGPANLQHVASLNMLGNVALSRYIHISTDLSTSVYSNFTTNMSTALQGLGIPRFYHLTRQLASV